MDKMRADKNIKKLKPNGVCIDNHHCLPVAHGNQFISSIEHPQSRVENGGDLSIGNGGNGTFDNTETNKISSHEGRETTNTTGDIIQVSKKEHSLNIRCDDRQDIHSTKHQRDNDALYSKAHCTCHQNNFESVSPENCTAKQKANNFLGKNVSTNGMIATRDCGDDMDNYITANAHLLVHLNEDDGRHEGGGDSESTQIKVMNGISSLSHSPTESNMITGASQLDRRVASALTSCSSDEDFYEYNYQYKDSSDHSTNDSAPVFQSINTNGIIHNNISVDSYRGGNGEIHVYDDQGDFIETDFVNRENYGLNSTDERDSSDEDVNNSQHVIANMYDTVNVSRKGHDGCNLDTKTLTVAKDSVKKVLHTTTRGNIVDEVAVFSSKSCRNNREWMNHLSDASIEDNDEEDDDDNENLIDGSNSPDTNSKTLTLSGGNMRTSVSHTSDSSMDTCALTPESLSLWSPDVEYPELNSIESGVSESCSRGKDYCDVHKDGGSSIREDERNLVESIDICLCPTEQSFNIPNIPNNLNEVSSSDQSSEDDLYNVSRQTSTSNFDNDENSYQGDDHSNTDNEDRLYDDAFIASVFGREVYSQEFHQKLRIDVTSHGRYVRLLDYNPSASDDDDDSSDREASEPIFVDASDEPLSSDLSPEQEQPQYDISNTEQRDENIAKTDEGKCHHQKHRKVPSIQKVMVWSEYEAYISQVKQIGRSACGPTAVINILKAFDIFCDKEKVNYVIKANLRAEKASVPEYLLSRSVAGTTAIDLIDGVHKVTDGAIYGRFFSFYPKRKVDLSRWLGYWISKGAVPLATLNLQKAVPPGWVTPDAWHHQMVYGVGPKGVYLTNPLEIVPFSIIEQQLCSDSVLLVRRSDVVARWTEDCDLNTMLLQEDKRWQDFNVLGQVVSVLREANAPGFQGYKLPWTSHILIPAVYLAGISLFVKHGSDSYNELVNLGELPICTKSVDGDSQKDTS
ncbi:uncharacterized protein LOC141902886 [Tubulanus polymorphus]|uniref:uncharacterized protein LOC141902886 n=1 Tax=Tubulanus polymorphus TaxID=672921 RepID=UPI003DA65BE6